MGAAGTTTLVLKSGTQNLHAQAWEFVRNDWLGASNYFTNAAGQPKPELRFNEWGFNVGGPIVIPHIYNGKDHAFWFFNYEGYRFSQGETVDVTVPTLKMRSGDFSELLSDPYVLQFFGGLIAAFFLASAQHQVGAHFRQTFGHLAAQSD